MLTQSGDLTKQERQNLLSLTTGVQGINVPIVDDARECLERFDQRHKLTRGLKVKTVESLEHVYRVFLRSEASKADTAKLFGVLGVTTPSKTPKKRLSVLIKATITTDRQYASKLCSVVCLALHKKVEINDFKKFVITSGGIARCVDEYAKLTVQRVSTTKANQTKSQKLQFSIPDATVKTRFAKVQRIASKAKAVENPTAKLRFYPSGLIEVRSLLHCKK